MRKNTLPAVITSFFFILAANIVSAQNAPSTSDLDQKIEKLQQQLNQLELDSESLKAKSEQGTKSLISLSGATLEQDFEANSTSWAIEQGQTLDLKFLAQPLSNVTGHIDTMILGNVAQDIFHYSYLPILANENVFVVLREADATFTTPDLTFTAFRGLGHASMYDSDDDFYYLFPEQWDIEKYFRISGAAIPTGMEIKGQGDLDGLDIWAGQELQWGAPAEIYGKYKHNIGPTTLGVLDKVQLQSISYTNPVTNLFAPAFPVSVLQSSAFVQKPQNEVEVFWKVPVADAFTADAVVLYNPINANMQYTYVTDVAPGTGTWGTAYQLFRGTTNAEGDALGYQLKLTTHKIPGIDSLMINGEHSGYIAGDLDRISGEITQIPAAYCLITADATVQKPLIGPNPAIFNGSSGNTIGAFVLPRSQYDPFRVTQDPISGINNREMSKFSLSFVFNNGKGWFFRYNPNNFGLWNVNTDLDTDFSFGIIGSMFNYPTSTDLTSFVDAQGQVVWEGSGSLGQPSTNGYLPAGQAVVMWKTGNVHWIADVEGGYSMASLGQSTVAGAGGRSSTDSLMTNLMTHINDTEITAGYGRDVWGPEDWDIQFGQSIGQLFLGQVTQKFGLSEVSLKYERWANLPGDPYQLANVNGVNLPADELYATYKLSF